MTNYPGQCPVHMRSYPCPDCTTAAMPSTVGGWCLHHHENLPCRMCASIANLHAACDARIAELEARVAELEREDDE